MTMLGQVMENQAKEVRLNIHLFYSLAIVLHTIRTDEFERETLFPIAVDGFVNGPSPAFDRGIERMKELRETDPELLLPSHDIIQDIYRWREERKRAAQIDDIIRDADIIIDDDGRWNAFVSMCEKALNKKD